jgi:hypothetical protein
MTDGQIAWCGHDAAATVRPTGPYDPDIPVIRFDDEAGGHIATLFSHSAHNIGTGGPVRSPGHMGMAARDIERELGGVVLFFAGAVGSTHGAGLKPVEVRRRIADAVLRADIDLCPGEITASCDRSRFSFCIRRFHERAEDERVRAWCDKWFDGAFGPRVVEVFREARRRLAPRQGERIDTWITILSLGPVCFVGVPGELFASAALRIRVRARLHRPHTYILGFVNDAVGYFPDREAFALGGYQTWTGSHSLCAPGTTESLVEHVLGRLIHAT